jgi:hypothetical protein
VSVVQEGFKAECSRQVQKLIWVASRSSYSHTYSARAGAAKWLHALKGDNQIQAFDM